MSGFPQNFVTKLTDVRASTEQHDVLGTVRWEGNKGYKYCQIKAVPTDDTVDAVAGDMAVYTDYSAHEVGVDITDVDGGGFAAGIFGGTIDISAKVGNFLWIQFAGPATLSTTVANSAAALDRISGSGTSAADKTFTLATTLKQADGVLINSTTKEVYLSCPF